MTYRITLPALALGVLLASAAAAQDYDDPTGGDPNPPAACAGVEAKISVGNGTSFTPATITVEVGQPVCWTWSTSIQHNVKADNGAFASGQPTDKGTFQYTFTAPGTYGYHCQVHGSPTSGMRGTVVVRDSSGGGGGGGGGGNSGGSGPGKIELSSAYSVNENAGSASITVERTGGGDGAASVKIQTSPGSAKPGKDFTSRNGTLTWANGDQSPKTFAVPIKNDTAPEQDETFTVKLSKATGASMGTSSATVTIHDDDSPGCGAGVTAPSKLRAQGQSAGEIRLTWADESSAAAAVRIERREPGGAFQEIASLPAGVTSFVDSGLPGGATFQYRIRTEGSEGTSPYSAIAAGATDGAAGACDGARALCLQNGRFEAKVVWRPSETETGREAKRLTLPEDRESGGLFALSPNDGPQLLLKVLDGCAVNGHYGLDLAGISDAEFTVKVRDTRTGRTWVYYSPGGGAPAPVHDVDAFSCR